MVRSFVVVGGGQQGLVAARALRRSSGRPAVTVVDARPAPPGAGVEWVRADAAAGRVTRMAAGADACVVALPGDLADRAVLAYARAGARVVDMSFVPEPARADIEAAAHRSGAVVVRDVGVAPGLSHVLAAALDRQLKGLDRLTIHVGGLPRRPPPGAFRHAVYFNALDLLSEYTRPARVRRGGRNLRANPLAARNERHVRDGRLGRLEAFPSDGLRTLLTSFPRCRQMEELTLRWPGHLKEMRRLARAGLLARGPGGAGPAMFTAMALDQAFPGRDMPDVLLMEVHGEASGRRAAWRVLDHGRGGQSAMSRTTAFTAVSAARALATGAFGESGLHGPEALGANDRARRALLAGVRSMGLRLGRRPQLRGTR